MSSYQRDSQPTFNPPATSQTTEWCLGLPRTGERLLTSEEIALLQRQASGFALRGILAALVGLVAVVGLFILIGYAIANPIPATAPPFLDDLLMCYFVGTIFLVIPIGVLVVRDANQRGQGLSQDVRIGKVQRFQGAMDQLDVSEWEDWNRVQALSSRLAGATTSNPQTVTLEVLPQAQRLWKVDGEVVNRWQQAKSFATSAPPSDALPATRSGFASGTVSPPSVPPPIASPLPPVRPNTDFHPVGQRSLSDSEVAELTYRIRKRWRAPFWGALILTLWLGTILALALFSQGHRPIELGDILVWMGMLYSDALCFAGLWHVRQLHRDWVQRTILIRHKVQEPDFIIEVLLHSGEEWTRNGQPAAWRKKSD